LELAHAQQIFGAEYVPTLVTLRLPVRRPTSGTAILARFPETVPQRLVERELQVYEQYVANGAALHQLSRGGGV